MTAMTIPPVIEISTDEIFETLDDLVRNSRLFSPSVEVPFINVYIFYSDDNEVKHYNKFEMKLSKSKITKKELMTLVLNHKKLNSKKYDLIGIHKFNFDLDQTNIKNFCCRPDDFSFMSQYSKIQAISVDPTIEIFQKYNSLILIFSHTTKSNTTESMVDESSVQEQKRNKTYKKVRFSNVDAVNDNNLRKTMKSS